MLQFLHLFKLLLLLHLPYPCHKIKVIFLALLVLLEWNALRVSWKMLCLRDAIAHCNFLIGPNKYMDIYMCFPKGTLPLNNCWEKLPSSSVYIETSNTCTCHWYGWLSEQWPWTTNETVEACTIHWWGNCESSCFFYLFLFTACVLSFPAKMLASYNSHPWSFLPAFRLHYLSGIIPITSSTTFLVTGWSSEDSGFYYSSRVHCHKHGFSSFSLHIAAWYESPWIFYID